MPTASSRAAQSLRVDKLVRSTAYISRVAGETAQATHGVNMAPSATAEEGRCIDSEENAFVCTCVAIAHETPTPPTPPCQ